LIQKPGILFEFQEKFTMFKKSFFVLFIILAVFSVVFSQNMKGAISGTISDPNGAAVSGAKVTATDTGSSTVRQTQTDVDGKFTFENLPFGDYSVRVSATGFNVSGKKISLSANEVFAAFQLSVNPVSANVTVESETARAEIERVPGGTALLPRKEIQQTLATNLKDVLNFTPGVLAQPRYGSDEAQISIRGSGLRNNYHLRGVNLLINNLPYGDADGFSDFESLEFLTANRVEVWKGANALRYGGNTAGGAINLVTETGETAFPLEIRLQGGAFGSYKGYVSTGGTRGRFGYFVGVSDTELKGYREHSSQGRRRLFSNFTFKYDENTDFYADLVFANFAEKYPGALTFSEYKTNPRQANPEDVLQDYGRFANYYRGAFGMKRRIGSRHELSFNISAQYRDLIHPIFNFLDQDTRTFSGEFRYSYTGLKNRFVVGFAPQTTLTGGRRFENNFGVRGAQAAHFDWVATNYGLYFENQYDFSTKFTLVAGGRVDFSKRRNTDFFLSNGDGSDKRNYKAFTPKIGFVYRIAENTSIFANVSRSYEPPLILELTSFGFNPGFLPLKAQDTWQMEVGTRGNVLNKRLDYELTFYNSEISNEVLNQNLQPFPNAPFTIPSFRSAPKTRHTGFELSTDAILAKNLFARNGNLSWRTAYTFANFKFTEDANFDGNFIPGQPKHLLRSELRYDHPKGFWIAPNVDWSPAAYFVNSANTFRNDSYAVFNFRVGFDRPKYGIFFEANNLTDRIYSASAVVDDSTNRFYEPANGRSAFVGFYYRFGKK
jgi:iron complex outermembrane recepter protein